MTLLLNHRKGVIPVRAPELSAGRAPRFAPDIEHAHMPRHKLTLRGQAAILAGLFN